MIELSVVQDINRAARDFGELTNKARNVALVRGINVGLRKVKTESAREVTKVYNVKQKVVRATITLLKASPKQAAIRGSVRFSGRRLPIMDFRPSAVNAWNKPGRRHNKRGGGVSVRIKKNAGRKLIAGAFLAEGPNGPGAFRRVGAARRELRNLRSIAVPDAVQNRAITRALTTSGFKAFRREMGRQLDLAIRRL